MNIPYVFKKCSKCGNWLVASKVNFNKHKTCKYGLRNICKKCSSEYNEQWYENNKDKKKQYRESNKDKIAERKKQYYENNKNKISEHMKQWYENNKDKIAERKKQWYENNKDKILEHQKQYQESNKEKISERNKQWYEDNKNKILEQKKQYYKTPQGQVTRFNSNCRRRTKEQNQGSKITNDQWLECMKFFGFRCAYSGQVLSKGTRSIDHIKPLNQGGDHEVWNTVPMDKGLNSSKSDKDMLEWYKKQNFYSEERLQKIYEWQEYAFNKWGK